VRSVDAEKAIVTSRTDWLAQQSPQTGLGDLEQRGAFVVVRRGVVLERVDDNDARDGPGQDGQHRVAEESAVGEDHRRY